MGKLKMMSFAKFCAYLFLLTLTSVLHAQGISEQDVKQLLNTIDIAIEAQDVKAIGALLSDDITITLNMNVQGQKQILKPNKQEYLQMLRENWSIGSNYTYIRSNIRIRLLDNKALVAADIFESLSMQGHKISSDSKEEVVIEWINGKARITEVTGYTGNIDSH